MKKWTALAAAVAVALWIGTCVLRDRAEDLGPAAWFEWGPGACALGQADGSLRFVDASMQPLGAPVPGGAASDVVFVGNDRALLIDGATGAIRRWSAAAPPAELAAIAPPAGGSLRALVEGSRARGVHASGPLALATLDAGGAIAALNRLDVESGKVEPIAADALPALLACASPDGASIALIRRVGERCELRVVALDAGADPAARFDDVEPVAPYWLPNPLTLLFARRAAGIARWTAGGGDAQWVCDGIFSAGVARSFVAPRVPGEPYVLLEKPGLQDYLQIVKVWPFETGDKRQVQITSGDIDHYGAQLSGSGRHVVYRTCLLRDADASADVRERLVMVDIGSRFRSGELGERSADRRDDRVGPRFAPGTDTVYWISAGRLLRREL